MNRKDFLRVEDPTEISCEKQCDSKAFCENKNECLMNNCIYDTII